MQVSGVVQSPPRPVVPPGATSLNVAYTAPVTRNEVIGQIPSDGFGVSPIDSSDCDTDVVRPQPVLDAAGQPTWATQTETLNLQPYSLGKKFIIGASIGAAIGAAVGMAAGYFAGNLVLGGSIGAGVGAASGAIYNTARVRGDRVTPDWELCKVVRHEFQGYDHSFIPQTTYITVGKVMTPITTGYIHTYDARVEQKQVGDYYYWHPVAKHSADS